MYIYLTGTWKVNTQSAAKFLDILSTIMNDVIPPKTKLQKDITESFHSPGNMSDLIHWPLGGLNESLYK